jgi:Uma2 family endonuclease
MSPVPDIAVVKSACLSNEDGPLQGSPDWLIEIRSPDQSTLDIQQKILHCLSNDTKLAWLIDLQKKQIWVWENQELPLIYADNDILPSLGNILELTVANVMAMTQQR